MESGCLIYWVTYSRRSDLRSVNIQKWNQYQQTAELVQGHRSIYIYCPWIAQTTVQGQNLRCILWSLSSTRALQQRVQFPLDKHQRRYYALDAKLCQAIDVICNIVMNMYGRGLKRRSALARSAIGMIMWKSLTKCPRAGFSRFALKGFLGARDIGNFFAYSSLGILVFFNLVLPSVEKCLGFDTGKA